MVTVAKLNDFLEEHVDRSSPLFLALSGGTDSLVLLHLLLQTPFKQHLRIAHVDHGWRHESCQEAEELRLLAEQFNLPFHLKQLDPAAMRGNLEAASREARLLFFRALCEEFKAQAVLLAHHADDQAETVLKRLFEGHSLASLHGMEPVSIVEGVKLLRPLLAFPKKNLVAWSKEQSLSPFEDETNFDPRFLRARMRQELLPELSRVFDKEIAKPLCRIAEEGQELRRFLDDSVKDELQKAVRGPCGVYLKFDAQHPYVAKHLLRRFCEQQGIILSHSLVNTVHGLLHSAAADRQVVIGGRTLEIDRGTLFLLEQQPPSTALELQEGTWSYGGWEVIVTQGVPQQCSDWRDLWRGEARVSLPINSYKLALESNGRLNKHWTDYKVPAFLRRVTPVILSTEAVAHEFLTGRSLTPLYAETLCLNITLKALADAEIELAGGIECAAPVQGKGDIETDRAYGCEISGAKANAVEHFCTEVGKNLLVDIPHLIK